MIFQQISQIKKAVLQQVNIESKSQVMQYNSMASDISKQVSKQGINYQTEDQLKPFRVSEMIEKQVEIEKMGPQQLIKYCHSQWTQWMKHMLQLQQCIKQQQQSAQKQQTTKTTPTNINQTKIEDQQNKQPKLQPIIRSNQEFYPNRQPIYPPAFMGKDFQQTMRSQNPFPIPPSNFMTGPFNPQGVQLKSTQPSSHHQFHPNLPHLSQLQNTTSFPFPQSKTINQGFPGINFEQSSYNQSSKRQFINQDNGQILKTNDKENLPKQ